MATNLTKRERTALLDTAVQHLRSLVFRSEIDKLFKVAEYLLEKFFDGDVALATSHDPNKETALADLALRADEFGMTAGGVWKAIPVMTQCRALGLELGRQLGYSQHVALLPVRDLAKKKRLAFEASRDHLSVRELRKKIKEKQPPHAGGRPPTAPLAGYVRHSESEIERRKLRRIRLAEGLDALEGPELRELLDAINGQQALLEAMEQAVTAAMTGG